MPRPPAAVRDYVCVEAPSEEEAAISLSPRRIEFLDVTDALRDRELCTADSWMHPFFPPDYGFQTEQAHPNRPGQSAYMRAVAERLGVPLR